MERTAILGKLPIGKRSRKSNYSVTFLWLGSGSKHTHTHTGRAQPHVYALLFRDTKRDKKRPPLNLTSSLRSLPDLGQENKHKKVPRSTKSSYIRDPLIPMITTPSEQEHHEVRTAGRRLPWPRSQPPQRRPKSSSTLPTCVISGLGTTRSWESLD